MSGQNEQLFKDFLIDSKFLAGQMRDILDIVESSPDEQRALNDFSNIADRIMGAAKSFAAELPPNHAIHLISDSTLFLKKIGKKMAEIDNTDQFYILCMGMLKETTGVVDTLLDKIDQPIDEIRKSLPEGLTDKLKTIHQQFYEGAGAAEMSQSEIDALMSKING